MANGKLMTGKWDSNKRIGTFSCIDPKGVGWTEKYDLNGKRTSRTKNRDEVDNPDWSEGAVVAEGDKAGEPVPKVRIKMHTVIGGDPAVIGGDPAACGPKPVWSAEEERSSLICSAPPGCDLGVCCCRPSRFSARRSSRPQR